MASGVSIKEAIDFADISFDGGKLCFGYGGSLRSYCGEEVVLVAAEDVELAFNEEEVVSGLEILASLIEAEYDSTFVKDRSFG